MRESQDIKLVLGDIVVALHSQLNALRGYRAVLAREIAQSLVAVFTVHGAAELSLDFQIQRLAVGVAGGETAAQCNLSRPAEGRRIVGGVVGGMHRGRAKQGAKEGSQGARDKAARFLRRGLKWRHFSYPNRGRKAAL